jgi:altronate dehydratase
VLSEVLDTDGLGDWFVFVRSRAGECVGVGALAAGGRNEFVVFTNGKGMDSGSCSDLKTSSKRARLKCASSVNPLKAGVVSKRVTRAALCSLCLNCSRLRR